MFISSEIGFCIADPFIVLADSRKEGITGFDIWDCYQEHPKTVVRDEKSGMLIATAETYHKQDFDCVCRLIYRDQNGREYASHCDCFSLIPLEVFTWGTPEQKRGGCQIFYGAGQASLEERDGTITIILPSGDTVIIDTTKYEEPQL